jgi:hypothetical protein
MAKSKSLWNFFDGEPFMENPHLAIVGLNPKRRKKGKKSMARRKSRQVRNSPRRRTGRKSAPRRKARRNFPTAGLAFNPRKRSRRRTRLANPRRHRRHSRARRNPALLGVSLPPIQMIAWGAGGFIVPPMIEGFVNKFLPASVTSSTLGRYAVKIASVLGLTWLVKTLMSNKEAFPVAMGGSMYIVVSAVNEFAPQLTQTTAVAATGTHAYRGGMINAYRGGMISSGVGQYTKGVNGSLPGLARALPGLAQPSRMMSPFNLNNTGMENPVFADPRFTFGNSVGR